MKTSIKLLSSALLLALSVSVATPALAIDDHTNAKAFTAVMFPAADASKLWLCLEKYQSDNKVHLELVNERGDIVFDEIVVGKNNKRNTFRQQFDMSQLTDGAYTFRISAGSQTEEFSFKLATPSVESSPSRLVAIK
ncbi:MULTISPECIES: hypothetical protein [unclassified Spirosoma]|uniref:hypothetical protein n=1 Tax=unclassified Spirosoma TaxID=2621999 RepID=UPI0009671D30|nr:MULTISPECIES: hypothetical protein [unclassified Spirosoma]MBN8823816.1 hypothetical protein [Spirosoma sp.]OJW79788.1 MAG: hypothetical protein BGO59_00625 [Spirosoma sp. 48-14]